MPRRSSSVKQMLAVSSVEPRTPVDFGPGDPLVAYLLKAGGVVELDRLSLDSSGLRELRAGGVKLAVPLIAQGELIGVLNMGPRLSQKEYSGDDRRLLEQLAAQAAPALRVAQLVREQESEARARERTAQELRVADLMQEHFMPDSPPRLMGWDLDAYYRPAPDVCGDFYDFVPLAGGQYGIVIADVADRGIRAAMVMAAARTLLRVAAQQSPLPGHVLQRVNDQLCLTMPPQVFVSCFYGLLDPGNGRLVYANAGHGAPFVRVSDGHVSEMRAQGTPLGLIEHMQYEERQVWLAAGDTVLLHSNGLAEACDSHRDTFGLPRTKTLMADQAGRGVDLLRRIVTELESFTGPGWQQEDDVTLITLQRGPSAIC